MNLYLTVKTLHILSAAILFGTGIGIAFFMLRSNFSHNLQERFYAVRTTVLADYIFTLPAVILQPATGLWLVSLAGFNWTDLWLVLTYLIYLIAGICWLPVVWIQIQLKKILIHSMVKQTGLPYRYKKLLRFWYLLGIPAFTGLVVVFFLMVFKPV